MPNNATTPDRIRSLALDCFAAEFEASEIGGGDRLAYAQALGLLVAAGPESLVECIVAAMPRVGKRIADDATAGYELDAQLTALFNAMIARLIEEGYDHVDGLWQPSRARRTGCSTAEGSEESTADVIRRRARACYDEAFGQTEQDESQLERGHTLGALIVFGPGPYPVELVIRAESVVRQWAIEELQGGGHPWESFVPLLCALCRYLDESNYSHHDGKWVERTKMFEEMFGKASGEQEAVAAEGATP